MKKEDKWLLGFENEDGRQKWIINDFPNVPFDMEFDMKPLPKLILVTRVR